MTIRPATPADAETILATVAEALAGYQAFVPGWRPPPAEPIATLRVRLAGPPFWYAMSETLEGATAGLAMVVEAPASRVPGPPGLGHLGGLFVRPPYWGTGLATALHAHAVAHAATAGFKELRLFTPERHARARRFYEREGWWAASEPFWEPPLGLELIEYRRAVTTRG